MNSPGRTSHGFTLLELTIVLIIVALLAGGSLLSLTASRDSFKEAEAQKQLAAISDALLGFAIINGRLPCPTSTTDPASPNYGVEDADCTTTHEGYLPWKSLGVPETDPWGSKRSTATEAFSGYWRYRIDSTFTTTLTLASALSASALVVHNAAGNTLTETGNNSPVAIIYSTGHDLLPNGKNIADPIGDPNDQVYQAGERSPAFDDMLVWISRPVLFNRLISAGKLP